MYVNILETLCNLGALTNSAAANETFVFVVARKKCSYSNLVQ